MVSHKMQDLLKQSFKVSVNYEDRITRKRKSILVFKAELYKIIDKKNSVNQIKETINIE